jgi:hydrogenase expression/formation protein HypC
MCLAIPGRIVRLLPEGPEGRVAEVDFGGLLKSVNLIYLPDAAVGEYVVVHAGFATDRVPESEALEAQRHFQEIQRLTAPADG